MNATTCQPQPCSPVELSARAIVASALAAAFRDPRTGAEEAIPSTWTELLSAAWEMSASPHAGVLAADLGLGELPPARAQAADLAAWVAIPASERAATLLRVFGMVVSRECPPFETEYCASRDSFHRAQHMADIAGFYNAFGLTASAEYPERHDHIVVELAFIASILERLVAASGRTDPDAREGEAVCRDGLASFFRDHAVWWMPTFARLVERRIERLLAGQKDPSWRSRLELLAGVTRFMRAWVAAERLALNVERYRRIVEPAVSDEQACDQACHACGPEAPASA